MRLDDFLASPVLPSPPPLPPAVDPAASPSALPDAPVRTPTTSTPTLTPCQSILPPTDLFGDGIPSPCNCRHFWRDAYGNFHCGACRPPANRSLVRSYVWVAEDGRNIAIPAGGRGDAKTVDVAGRGAGGDRGGVQPVLELPAGAGQGWPQPGPLFIGDRRAKLRLICQQQPGELFEDWWERAAEADAFMWEVIALKEAGKLPGQQSQGLVKMPTPPAGKELFYLVAVGGGKSTDEEAGTRRIVSGKKANNFKRRLAITWEGADRWWPVATEESAVNPETRLASSTA